MTAAEELQNLRRGFWWLYAGTRAPLDLDALRAEWASLQQEPLDQYWVGPGAFVERLLGLVENQTQRIDALRVVLGPFLTDVPRHGVMQVAAARAVWQATQEAGTE